jgi:metal-responsive CopG/Arc/MetJ family transcriptional regulator
MDIIEKTEMTIYSLSLPKKVYLEIRAIANNEGSTAKQLFNDAIKDYLKKYKGV